MTEKLEKAWEAKSHLNSVRKIWLNGSRKTRVREKFGNERYSVEMWTNSYFN